MTRRLPGSRTTPSHQQPHCNDVPRAQPLQLSGAVRLILGNAQRFRDTLAEATVAAETAGAAGAAPQRCGVPNDALSTLVGRRWWQHEVEVVVRKAVDVSRGVSAAGYLDELLRELGWDRIPDPKKQLRTGIKTKFSQVRAALDHGTKPEDVAVRKAEARNMAFTYKAWALKAFEALPGHQGTLNDVCAFLQADPSIAPRLDKRLSLISRTVPRWRDRIGSVVTLVRGVSSTGEKRDGYTVYRYDRKAAVVAAGGGRRAPKRGRPGLPLLGKGS